MATAAARRSPAINRRTDRGRQVSQSDAASRAPERAPHGPILVGIGGNLPSRLGPTRTTLEAALSILDAAGARVIRRSRWYRSAPVPPSDQPWYLNAVAALETALDPPGLLALLHDVEARLERVRSVPNAARTADLDLLAYGDLVRTGTAPLLPHPRLAQRAFVLLPLAEVAPGWRHPGSGAGVAELIAALPAGQRAEPVG